MFSQNEANVARKQNAFIFTAVAATGSLCSPKKFKGLYFKTEYVLRMTKGSCKRKKNLKKEKRLRQRNNFIYM